MFLPITQCHKQTKRERTKLCVSWPITECYWHIWTNVFVKWRKRWLYFLFLTSEKDNCILISGKDNCIFFFLHQKKIIVFLNQEKIIVFSFSYIRVTPLSVSPEWDCPQNIESAHMFSLFLATCSLVFFVNSLFLATCSSVFFVNCLFLATCSSVFFVNG